MCIRDSRLGQPEIPVSELVYITRRAQRALLNYFYNHRSQGTTIRWNEGLHDTYYRFYPDGKSGHSTMPYMMSRIAVSYTHLTIWYRYDTSCYGFRNEQWCCYYLW